MDATTCGWRRTEGRSAAARDPDLGRGYVIIGSTLVVLALALLGLGSYALAVLWPITDYRVHVAVGCFRPWPSDPRLLEVRGGQAVALLDTTGRPAGPLVEPCAPNTVEGMFAFIDQAARSADLLVVRYDRCLGNPTEIRGDQRVGRPDDWFWTKATGLTPRR